MSHKPLIHSHSITAGEYVKIGQLALGLGIIRLELMTQNIIPMHQNVQLGTTHAKQVFYFDTSAQALVHTLTDMHQITHSPTCKNANLELLDIELLYKLIKI